MESDARQLNWPELLGAHGAALMLYARQVTGSVADAQDAVQDGFLRFWRFWKGGTEGDAVPYLFRAVRTSAIDIVRRRGRLAKHETSADEPGRVLREPVALFENALERDEQRRIVESEIGRLPAEQREVLVMKIWGEMTFDQIAKSLGASINTVASRYRYAIAALGRKLDGEALR